MPVENTDTYLDKLLEQLAEIEGQCSPSNLMLYYPSEEQEQALYDLCRFYLETSSEQRARIRTWISDKEGLLNRCLGYVHKVSKQIHSVEDGEWLRIGLAAASIENCRFDYRDFLLALAELYVTAEEAGLDPRGEFKAVATLSSKKTPRGGGTTSVSSMLSNFHRYAVLKERRRRPKKAD